MLDLTLHGSDLKKIEVDKILRVIGWRNDIVHKRGQLPPELPSDTLEKHLGAVLNLIGILARRRESTEAEPELAPIRETLWKMGDIIPPSIWLRASHHIRMDIKFIQGKNAATLEPRMREFVVRAGEMLRDRDRRFDPNKHLEIHFITLLDETLAWYSNGALTLAPRSDAPADSSSSP